MAPVLLRRSFVLFQALSPLNEYAECDLNEQHFLGLLTSRGASYTKVVLVNEDGQILSEDDSEISTNCLLVGMDECQRRVYNMVQSAKLKAGIDPSVTLTSLGLSMSGCEQEETITQLEREMTEKYPDLSASYTVTSDTVGSVLTASPNGGVVLISGTGSNSLVINPDGSIFRCGGWGNMYGDEGSAFWIALRAVKTVIDEEDNLATAPYCIKCIKALVWEHFKLKDKLGLVEYGYTKFNKPFFASLTKKLAEAAINTKDPMCCQLFRDGGLILGRHVSALMPNIHKELLDGPAGLKIICVGSVWKSWELLKQGFLEGLQPRRAHDKKLNEFTLIRLKNTPAVGAAYLGAKITGYTLPIDDTNNGEVFFHWKEEKRPHLNGVNGVNGVNGTHKANGVSSDIIAGEN